MPRRIALYLALLMPVLLCAGNREDGQSVPAPRAENNQATTTGDDPLKEVNNRIRREKFDKILPEVMRKNKLDMWIHVMREGSPDPFGAEDLGSTSGVFVFTDRGSDRIERAILERRWGDSFAFETWRVDWDTRTVEEAGAYDIIGDAVLVKQPSGGPDDGVRLSVQRPSRVRRGTRSEDDRGQLQAGARAISDDYPRAGRLVAHRLPAAGEGAGPEIRTTDRVVRARDHGLHHPEGAD